MAFSTIQGSGGAPDSFVGTTGVDTIAIIDTSANFFLGAQGDNDVVSFTSSAIDAGVVSNATLKGGAGIDTFNDLGGFNNTLFNGVWFNGNANADTFNFFRLVGSTVQGGQGDDTLNVGNVGSSLVNGNKNDDTITVTGGTSSSVFGGQGDDTISVTGTLTNSAVAGDKDDDTITTAAPFVGGSGDFSIVGTTFDGGEGNDTINLSTVTTATNGGVSISGGDGNDVLTGTGGADTVDGGAGNDLINGGAGADRMSGGSGVDTFAIVSGETAANATDLAAGKVDVITDWSSSDFISGNSAFVQNNLTVGAATAADYNGAFALATAAGAGNFVYAVGSGTSWTAYLFRSTGAGAGSVTNAVQLGETGTFVSSVSATSSIVAAQIVA